MDKKWLKNISQSFDFHSKMVNPKTGNDSFPFFVLDIGKQKKRNRVIGFL